MLEALHHLDSPTRFTFDFVGVGSLDSVKPHLIGCLIRSQ